jgi:hypothetical protein
VLLPAILELGHQLCYLWEVGARVLGDVLAEVVVREVIVRRLGYYDSARCGVVSSLLITWPVSRLRPRGEYATTVMPSSRAVSSKCPFCSMSTTNGEYYDSILVR